MDVKEQLGHSQIHMTANDSATCSNERERANAGLMDARLGPVPAGRETMGIIHGALYSPCGLPVGGPLIGAPLGLFSFVGSAA